MRAITLASAVTIAGLLTACSAHAPEANLRTDAARVCREGQSLLLSKRSAESQYHLGQVVVDSARLGPTLAFILAPRPSKVVLVDVSRRPSRPPLWLVTAIWQAGGDAFEADSACLLPSLKLSRLGRLPLR
jgi:hypothetical protein